MKDHRFDKVASNVILAVLVAIGTGTIWLASYAYGEILNIQEAADIQTAELLKK